MGILSRIKRRLGMHFNVSAKEELNIGRVRSNKTQNLIERCVRTYRGEPDWVNEKEHIKTVNFAKAACSETARLATLAIGVKISGSARADWLQERLFAALPRLRAWVEYGCAFGTVILKPCESGVDMYAPDRFAITAQSNGRITGAAFEDRRQGERDGEWYARVESHRFLEDGAYLITNRCYAGDFPGDKGRAVKIGDTPWKGLREEERISGIDRPLFGVLKTPHANNADIGSPLALPIFSDALEELKDLDVAYSRNAKEILDSKRTVLLDSDRLLQTGGKVKNIASGFAQERRSLGLPDMIKCVFGSGQGEYYQEINPTLNTEARLAGINALLSQIGYKIGFSNGHFAFNESGGLQTATEVEANQRRTIQLIKDVRDQLESCLDDLIYALNAFADLYEAAPAGPYEAVYDFGDITYNYDEDRSRWYGYAVAGKIPFWRYLVKFEGFSEEEAKAIEAEAHFKGPALFEEEE